MSDPTSLILSKVGGIGTNANQKVLAQNWGQQIDRKIDRYTATHTPPGIDLLHK